MKKLLPLIPFCCCLSPLFANPCNEINGNWNGFSKTEGCRWNIEAKGSTNKDSFRLETISSSESDDCGGDKERLVLSGICKDGVLEVIDPIFFKGTVSKGFIFLVNSHCELQFNKTN